jgi:mRNA interferase HigB
MMRVICNRVLRQFGQCYPDADNSLQHWRRQMESRDYLSFADLRSAFGSVDLVGDRMIFDIRGNRYRLITYMDLIRQVCFVKDFLTHDQYDRGKWMKAKIVKEDGGFFWTTPHHPRAAFELNTPDDYDVAVLAIDKLVDDGAINHQHPHNDRFMSLFDAIHAYEKVHYP